MPDSIAQALQSPLTRMLGAPARVTACRLIPGGASKESWWVDAEAGGRTHALIVRRNSPSSSAGEEVLSLENEHRLLALVHARGASVPRPWGFIPDLDGRPAYVMDRVDGVSIGRKVVRDQELDPARAHLPRQMAESLAAIHAVPPDELEFLPAGDPGESPALRAVSRMERELDRLGEPHPAIEFGLAWLRRHCPEPRAQTLVHGDFRVGNLMVDRNGLAAVLDWELAHWGDPAEDLGWPLIRAWRFGRDDLRLGGVGPVEPFLDRYNELTGRAVDPAELDYWELLGNVNWAVIQLIQRERHLSGREPSVELAVLGRLSAETEREILAMLERLGD
ncbi:MAG TPA: phosphotransferase family protein [Gammaproteobacteria bacterium]|nr:phosphotransferase family protein [Gammaproteobacteria bacterium]